MYSNKKIIENQELKSRTQPCNVEVEQRLLGCLLLNDREAIETARAILKPNDFYKTEHRRLYETILELSDSGAIVDNFEDHRYQKLFESNPDSKILNKKYLEYLLDSTPSSSRTEEYAKLLKELSNLRTILHALFQAQERVYLAEGTALEISSELSHTFSQLALPATDTIPCFYDELIEVLSNINDPNKSEFLGFKTGFKQLNEKTLGLRGLIALTGVPGQGKTTYALQLAVDIAKLNNVPVLYYTLEQSKWDLYIKIISRISQLDYSTLRIGSLINDKRSIGLSREDKNKLDIAIDELNKYSKKITIIDRSVSKINLSMIKLHIQQEKKKHNADQIFVVIDHLQIFPVEKEYLELKARLDYVLGELRAISEIYNATILFISQKNRQSYNKNDLGSFMGSAEIEYTADIALSLSDPKEDNLSTALDYRELNLNIIKQRFGFGKNEIRMKFYPKISAFEEV